MSKLTDAVLALAEPVAAQQGCEIWDVEYVKEAVDLLAQRSSPTEQEVYAGRLAEETNISKAAIMTSTRLTPFPTAMCSRCRPQVRSGSSNGRAILRAFSERRSRCGSISRWTAARCTSARSSSMTTAT